MSDGWLFDGTSLRHPKMSYIHGVRAGSTVSELADGTVVVTHPDTLPYRLHPNGESERVPLGRV